MAGITLDQAQEQLSNWLTASTAVAKGQSYTIAGKTLTRADAGRIQSMIDYWDRKVKELSGERKITVRGATPL
ncbi:MAG: DUF6148 family protein [bacterium]|jgi:hypothetical protein